MARRIWLKRRWSLTVPRPAVPQSLSWLSRNAAVPPAAQAGVRARHLTGLACQAACRCRWCPAPLFRCSVWCAPVSMAGNTQIPELASVSSPGSSQLER